MRNLVITLALAFVASACNSHRSTGSASLDDSTKEIVYRNSNIYQCGDRIFQTGAYSTDELKNPTFDVAEQEVTEADGLNGIRWRAKVSVYAPTTRSYSQQADATAPSWSDWQSRPSNMAWELTLVKRDTGVQAEYPEHTRAARFSCANIPAG